MDDKKKILLIHNYYQIAGGEDTVVANEIAMLREHGHEVHFYNRNNFELKDMSRIQKLKLVITTIFNPKSYTEIKKIIKTKKIDIVHVHNTMNLISPAVYYAAWFCKVPVVQTIHNFRLLCPGATFYRDDHICEECIEHGLYYAVQHSCYRNSKAQTFVCVLSTKLHRMTGIYGKLNYICLTDFNKEKLLCLKQIKANKVFVKPNFVKNDSTIIPYEQRENQFVFVGRLDKLKGIDLLLQVWKQIEEEQEDKTPKLIICGTGQMENWCKNYITEKHLQSVEMRGFVPNIEVNKIIALSKALILPTRCYEGFPMTIVEAYSVGTPVIGSDIGNVGSLIQNGVTGWKFKTMVVTELTTAITALEQKKEIYMSTYRVYKDHYTENQNYNILDRIYKKMGR